LDCERSTRDSWIADSMMRRRREGKRGERRWLNPGPLHRCTWSSVVERLLHNFITSLPNTPALKPTVTALEDLTSQCAVPCARQTPLSQSPPRTQRPCHPPLNLLRQSYLSGKESVGERERLAYAREEWEVNVKAVET
jgi:hypothetical protein